MFKRLFLPFLLAVIAIVFYSCSDTPTSIGSDLVQSDLIQLKSFNTKTDSVDQTSSSFKRVIPLGGSSTLLLGKRGNLDAVTMIKFNFSFDDSISTAFADNSINIKSAVVKLYKKYDFGDANASIDYSVHKINQSWSSSNFDADSLPGLNYDASDISSQHNVESDTLFTFNLDPSIVLGWIKMAVDSSGINDNGILIKAAGMPNRIAGFQALTTTATDLPVLSIVIEKPGVYQDTLTYTPLADLSAVTGEIPPHPDDDFVVQSSVTVNGKLWFDLSKLPEKAIINNATLYLTTDYAASDTGSGFTNKLYAYIVQPGITIDSVMRTSPKTLNPVLDTDILKGDITNFVQYWVDKQTNEGLIITPYEQANGLTQLAFKGSSAADAAFRPRLEIIYTIKK